MREGKLSQGTPMPNNPLYFELAQKMFEHMITELEGVHEQNECVQRFVEMWVNYLRERRAKLTQESEMLHEAALQISTIIESTEK